MSCSICTWKNNFFFNLANNKFNPVVTEVMCFPSLPFPGLDLAVAHILLCALPALIAGSSVRETELLAFGAVIRLFRFRLQ